MILACLILTTSPLLHVNDVESELTENTLAIYDLAALATYATPRETASNWLLPFFRPLSDRGSWSYSEEDLSAEVEDIYSILFDLFPDEFEFEGRSAELLENRAMIVRGPAALHARIADVLEFFDSILNASVELTVDFLRVEDAMMLPKISELPDDKARALVARHAQSGESRSLVLRVRADREVMIDLRREHSVLMSYMLEVAEKAAIHCPRVETAAFGTRLGIRATPTSKGLSLALSILRGHLLGGMTESDIGLGREIASDVSFRRMDSPATVQGFELANRSVALNTLLRDGHAILLSNRVLTARGVVQDLVVIRKTGGGLPFSSVYKNSASGLRLAVLNAEALAPARLTSAGSLLALSDHSGTMQMKWDGLERGLHLVSDLVPANPDLLLMTAIGDLEQLTIERYGPWAFLFAPASVDSTAGATEFSASLTSIDSLVRDTGLINFAFSVRRGGTPGMEIARVSLPLHIGYSSSFVLGVESLAVVDFDVEIAKQSAAPVPVTASLFDGIAMWVLPRRTPSGGIALEIRGGAHFEVNRTRTDPGSQTFGWIDQRDYDQLLLNEKLIFEAQEGPRTLTLGASGGKPTESLRFEITIEG